MAIVSNGTTIIDNGSLSVATGKVIQVVQSVVTAPLVLQGSTGAFNTISQLSTNITPSSSSSKILVNVNLTGGPYSGIEKTPWSIFRAGSQIALGDASGSLFRMTSDAGGVGNAWPVAQSMSWLDTPNTTSTITYEIKYYRVNSSSTFYLNRTGANRGGTDSVTASSVILTEIGA